MPPTIAFKRVEGGTMIVDDRKCSLADIIALMQDKFQVTSFDEVYFPRPDYQNEWSDLIIAKVVPVKFQVISGGFQAPVIERITLKQVVAQAESLHDCDFSKVSLMWDKQGFHMHVKT